MQTDQDETKAQGDGQKETEEEEEKTPPENEEMEVILNMTHLTSMIVTFMVEFCTFCPGGLRFVQT